MKNIRSIINIYISQSKIYIAGISIKKALIEEYIVIADATDFIYIYRLLHMN